MSIDITSRIEQLQIFRMATPRVGIPCCSPVLHGRFGEKDADILASAFNALADPARLKPLSFIAG